MRQPIICDGVACVANMKLTIRANAGEFIERVRRNQSASRALQSKQTLL